MCKKLIWIGAVLLCGAAVLIACLGKGKRAQAVSPYRVTSIRKATIVQEVSATGIVNAVHKVNVGTQVTGKIVELLVDYNSNVTEGQVIARIDPLTYEANYQAACAQLASAVANRDRTRTSLELAEKELARSKVLREKKMVSESDYDAELAKRDELLAQLQGNEAAIRQAEATVKLQKTNLEYCTIYSPVTGVVLNRDVDQGQTVVSSMNASSLFTIATDLSRIQVEASVPEADIGQVKVGQKVEFMVDAYTETFRGTVKQIRMAATTSSNVVTYPVIVEAENPGCKLFPGMTATISIVIAEAKDAWAVPNAALRFKPPQPVPAVRQRVLWVDGGEQGLRPLPVRLGITDGVQQQIFSDEKDLEQLKIVTGMMTSAEAKAAGEATSNPFMPKFPRGKQKNSGGGAQKKP